MPDGRSDVGAHVLAPLPHVCVHWCSFYLTSQQAHVTIDARKRNLLQQCQYQGMMSPAEVPQQELSHQASPWYRMHKIARACSRTLILQLKANIKNGWGRKGSVLDLAEMVPHRCDQTNICLANLSEKSRNPLCHVIIDTF